MWFFEKVLKDIGIDPFDICGITSENAEKYSCLRNALKDSSAKETDVNINDIMITMIMKLTKAYCRYDVASHTK